ncbi:unnamed protein product, partial [marine sediment metagenome]
QQEGGQVNIKRIHCTQCGDDVYSIYSRMEQTCAPCAKRLYAKHGRVWRFCR